MGEKAEPTGIKYPPSEFSQKYSRILAPNGVLVSPEKMFGEGKPFGPEIEEKTKLAFKVTLKKLDKLNPITEQNKHILKNEKIDQIVECFPGALPKNLPEILGKTTWGRPPQEVKDWKDWWNCHKDVLKALEIQTGLIKQWWKYIDRAYPGDEEILESLKRLISGVITHPLTIGKVISTHVGKKGKDKAKSIHMVGTDRPEATMIYSGFFTEILAVNPTNPIKLTLVSPDPANQQLAQDCSPSSPMLIHQRCKLTAWDGLYHDFWDRFVEKKKVEKPDVVLGIHPGLHAEGVYEFWEPTLELLLDQNIVTVFTFFSREEYESSLLRFDDLFVKYISKESNLFGSQHLKQTPHNPELMWASNMYSVAFQGRTVDMKTLTLIE
ncbi:putative protein MSS51 homolog, mitochondrial [Eurytemora carolleeae]|uniref:putative protein MSS51 homolog, mitochondrial n=1 Tax=Eurytemora carolleeae TaxID=1294199 RepID=UPI000C782087|nr:putative protein MSS51 homolog, mitochondrial [Eurytemora carolleeae]|eukprot:XP_023327013.1 putative protein MSS51 homolog, mitochondrial [Eurytemora affinis]